jgi:transporter family-2 protein
MYKFLGIVNGVLVAVMILFNGILAEETNMYVSILSFYLIGLSITSIVIIFKRKKLKPFKSIPIYLFLAGILGVLNVFFNNITFINLGATLTLGLAIYGQLIASVIVDYFGLFGLEKQSFNYIKVTGLAVISLGIFIMIIF